MAVLPVKVEFVMETVVPATVVAVAIAPPMPPAVLELNVEPLIVKEPACVGR